MNVLQLSAEGLALPGAADGTRGFTAGRVYQAFTFLIARWEKRKNEESDLAGRGKRRRNLA